MTCSTSNSTNIGDSMKARDQKKILAFGDIFRKNPTLEDKKYRHKKVRDSSDYTMIKGLIPKRLNR